MAQYRFGICEWCLPAVGPSVCRLAVDAGLEGVALDLGSLQSGMRLTDPRIRRYYMEQAQHAGVGFCALALNVFGKYTLLHPEDAAEAEVVRYILDESVAAAAEMGIPVIQVPSFFGNAMNTEADIRASATYFRYACERAEPLSIVIGSENTLDAGGCERLLEMVDRPNFAIYFDTENPAFFGAGDSPEMIRRLAGDICQIHVKDGTDERLAHTPLGQGHGRFHDCAAAIRETGYSGWIILENEYTDFRRDNDALLAADIAEMRAAFGA